MSEQRCEIVSPVRSHSLVDSNQHSDGEAAHIEVSSNVVSSLGRVVDTVSDISQAQQVFEDPSMQEEIFRKIFDHFPVMISLVGADGRYQLVNREWERTLGWSLDEVLARGQEIFSDLYPDPLGREEALSFIARTDADWKDFKPTTKDGRVIDTMWARLRLAGGTSISIGRETTDHRLAEEALRQVEQEYRNIFENTHEGIFRTTADGRCLVANPALARMLGFDSPADLIGERNNIAQQGYLDPARRDEFKRLLDENGAVTDFEFQALRKDGSKIWLSENVRAVRDENGELLYYEGTAQDITERKRAENKSAGFAALARKLSGAMTALRAAQIIADTAHDLFGFDSLSLDLYDADRDVVYSMLNVDIIGGQLVDVTPPGNKYPPTPQGLRVIQRGAELIVRKEHYEFDHDSIPFGESRPSAVSMNVPIRHATSVVGILSIQSNTPLAYDNDALVDFQALADHCGEALNRIRAEQSLHESQERYRELFENARDAIYVHDLRGRYTSLNHAAEELTGFSRDEILGKNFGDFVAPEYAKGVRDNLCKKLADGTQTVYEVEVLTRDGRRVPVEVNSRLIYEDGIPVGVQGTVRDITERKQSQAALQNFSRRLIEAQEAERQLLSHELHDEIGQVLTAVRINLETIQRDSDPLTATSQIEDSLSIIDEALKRVRNMSLDLRPPHLDDFGLASALRWYIDRYSKRAGNRVRLIDEQPADQPRLRRDLETACFRIVQEALTNVARHANAKSVSVRLARSNGHLLLTIEDDGAGFEVGALRKDASANATLGVRGMEERAKAVGGRFEIESAKGDGTRIRASFPVARPEA